MEDRYEQLKVAVQDLLIEVGISPSDLRSVAARADYADDHIGAKVTVKTAQKLLDAGILLVSKDDLNPVEMKVLVVLDTFGPQGCSPKEIHDRMRDQGFTTDSVRNALYHLNDRGTIAIDPSLKITRLQEA